MDGFESESFIPIRSKSWKVCNMHLDLFQGGEKIHGVALLEGICNIVRHAATSNTLELSSPAGYG